ncbi:hypothetical protein [Nitrospirillum sp. BR 11828]|uniref:hypothetical protein n=1 Tax=Nitrospirillum sp. BR 11828 TaxID=3104325 RepID=UPI002ACA477C|nr:hypothetical protein [Nitrospirillum sp. BR 11828]MDZ5649104.1 hypothetical protein [Nitrospirillum sp. BR 11828]
MTPPDTPETDPQALCPAQPPAGLGDGIPYGQDPDGAAARMRHLFHTGTAAQTADCRALAELLLNAATDLTAADALAVEAILQRQPVELRGWLLQRATALAAATGRVRHKIATAANLQ